MVSFSGKLTGARARLFAEGCLHYMEAAEDACNDTPAEYPLFSSIAQNSSTARRTVALHWHYSTSVAKMALSLPSPAIISSVSGRFVSFSTISIKDGLDKSYCNGRIIGDYASPTDYEPMDLFPFGGCAWSRCWEDRIDRHRQQKQQGKLSPADDVEFPRDEDLKYCERCKVVRYCCKIDKSFVECDDLGRRSKVSRQQYLKHHTAPVGLQQSLSSIASGCS
jgi:hypothetical protein